MKVKESLGLKLGIIGCGAVIQRFYIPALLQMQNIKVVGVADRNRHSAEEVAERLQCAVVDSADLPDLAETVIIATPPVSHFNLCDSMLRGGCDVLVEKPFVTARSHAMKLCALASQLGRNIWVGHFRRYFPGIILARELVVRGIIGTPERIEMHEGGVFKWQSVSDYTSSDPFGGVLFDTGSHTLDCGLFIANLDHTPLTLRVKRVARDKTEPAHDFEAHFELEGYAKPAISCRIHISRYHTLANRVKVFGSAGWIDCGVEPGGSVRIGREAEALMIRAFDKKVFDDYCFREQLSAVLQNGSAERVEAYRFLNQISILDELLNSHG